MHESEFLAYALPMLAVLLASAVFAAQRSDYGRARQAERAKNKDALRDRILNRLSNGLLVTAYDFDRFCNALSLTQHEAKHVVDGLYSEPLTQEFTAEVVDSLDNLLRELEEKQSFDDLPAEFRPSLTRIKRSLSDSQAEEANAILTPVINAIQSSEELNRRAGRMKLHRNIAYVISAASLVVGLATMYLTPSAEELGKAIQDARLEASQTATDEAIRRSP